MAKIRHVQSNAAQDVKDKYTVEISYIVDSLQEKLFEAFDEGPNGLENSYLLVLP